jgi:hypothetical protein
MVRKTERVTKEDIDKAAEEVVDDDEDEEELIEFLEED